MNLDELVETATAATGHDDFGGDSWREGAEILLRDFAGPADLHEIGVEVVKADFQTYLQNRLGIVAHRTSHPDLDDVPITAPVVVVGQPRTGTTILFDLLAQDSRFRVPRSWEVDRPCPPPTPETYDSDPRIAEVQASYDAVDTLIPGFSAFHEVGATLGQECVRMTAGEFRSLIFPIQYHVPEYNEWLLHTADLAPAYDWHRTYLQHLSHSKPGRWLIKSPAHLWHLPSLRQAYPDAVLIRTHRDPLKVISSVSALGASLRRLAQNDPTISTAAAQYAVDIPLGLDRVVESQRTAVFPAEQVVDVHFTQFVADPLGCIARLYGDLGWELTAETEQRMKAFLAEHPGDGGGAGTRYSFHDTGLSEGDLRERTQDYVSTFGVELEPVR